PSPSVVPRGRSYSILRAVSSISRKDVWAAGYAGVVRPTVTRTLIEHWDGRRWTIVRSPSVRSARGALNNTLFSVSGSRPDDVWAVGSWGSLAGGYGGKGDHALALHWDGRRWSRVALPTIRQRSLLSGVLARGGRAWAVGDRGLQPSQETLIERRDSVRWSVVPSPRGFGFTSVSRSPDGTLWALGARARQPLAPP